MPEPEEAEREEDRRRGCLPGPARGEPAGDDEDLAGEERRRRQPGERSERDPHRRAERGRRAAHPGGRAPAGARDVREQRRGRVEAERLGDRVARHVHDDAGHREGVANAKPRARTPMCSRLEYASSRFQASERQRNGTATASETSPNPSEDSLRHLLADGGRERLIGAPRDDENGRQERAREQGRDGRRRLGVRIGEPVVDRRPADLGREAAEEEHERGRQLIRPGVERASELHESPPSPPSTFGRDEDDAEEREPEPERRQHEVLPPCLESRGAPAEPDEERGRGRRRLDQEPRDAEVPGERDGDEHRPEREERCVVQARPAFWADELGARRRRGTRVT